MPIRVKHRVLAGVAVTAALGALGLAGPATASPVDAPVAAQPLVSGPLNYVALGDSYSAGSGVLPLSDAPAVCAQTSKNYPHLLAGSTGANLKDVSCGAAETKHFTESQYPGVAPQIDAVRSDTDLVTLTIGGNDNNTFIGAIMACGSAGVVTGGLGSPCKTLYGSKFDDHIDNSTYPALKEAFAKVRAKAPNARVAALGYPWIVPAQSVAGCFVKLPIAQGDVPYLHALQAHLNAVVAKAAQETGVSYVDLAAASDGHDACAPAATRWIEPVLGGTNFVPVHPNAAGEAGMAAEAAKALKLG